MKKILFGAIGAVVFGNSVWVLALVNFVWLLVKNTALFSWWWVIGSIIGFLVSLAIYFIGIVNSI